MKNIHKKGRYVFFVLLAFSLAIISCSGAQPNDLTNSNSGARQFTTSFESINDFNGFYISPQNYMSTSSHDLSFEQIHSGSLSHKGWIYGVNPIVPGTNTNHRGYPTIQFQKTTKGVFHCPCYITMWAYLNMNLYAKDELAINSPPENQWFSFATFTPDPSDLWDRTILVNLSHDDFVHLMHVPLQGQSQYLFQTTTVKFPQNQWVELKIYLDLDATNGYAKVWQDGVLVSHALVSGVNGTLAQAHFGLYAHPTVSSGAIFNDDIVITEVNGE